MFAADLTQSLPDRRETIVDLRPHLLRGVIRQRVARARHFNSELFVDPAWDIILDLGLARLSGQPVAYRAAAALPPRSLDRWLDLLAAEGLVERDETQACLSDRGLASLDAWMAGR